MASFARPGGLPRKKRRTNYWLIYTIAFGVMMAVAFAPFWANGRTLISTGDSTSEFYPATLYIGRWYREVLRNFWHGEFTLPMFDPNIVLGEDAYSLMAYYNLGNPLFFLTALVPTRWMPLLFQLSIPVQYYLAGAAFSLYCFYMKKGRWQTLAGTMVYLSCGYMFKVCAMYIDFFSPLIYLPLLLLGFEAVLRGRSMLPLVFAAWFAGLTEVYFVYMCGIFLIFYGLVRGIELYGWRRLKEWFLACLRAVGGFALGLVLAMPVLLPAVWCFFTSERSGTMQLALRDLLPSLERLRGLLVGSWMLTEGAGRNNIALCAIAIMAVLFLVVRCRRRYPALCIGALLAGGLYLLPFTDYLMNAFAGQYDRWVFLLAFVWALAVVYVFPALLHLRSRDKLLLCGAVLLAFLYGVLGPQRLNRDVLAAAAVMALTLAAILAAQRFGGVKPRQWGPMLLCGAVLLNASLIGYWHYADAGDGFAKEGHDMAYVEASIRSAYSEFPQLAGQTGQNYRVDNAPPEINSAMLEGYPGINGYWSLLNSNMVKGLRQFGVMPPGWNVTLTGKSPWVQALLGVRYKICRGEQPDESVPGYTLAAVNGENYLYENTSALPIAGYTYAGYITQHEYEALNPVQKQQMVLKAIALEQTPPGIPAVSAAGLAQPLRYELAQENVNYQAGTLDLGWWSGTLQLRFQAPASTRLMLYFQGAQGLQYGINVTASCAGVEKGLSFGGQKADYVVDLGYSTAERTGLTIGFGATQDYQLPQDILLEGIALYAVPESEAQADLEALGQDVLQDVVMGTNKVTGNIQLDQAKILCIALPYSPAWKAEVDGQPAEILQGNTMFMALPLAAGSHTVELTYCTPGFKLGSALFAVGALLLALLIGQERRKGGKKFVKEK